jgi:hypothetical protein
MEKLHFGPLTSCLYDCMHIWATFGHFDLIIEWFTSENECYTFL